MIIKIKVCETKTIKCESIQKNYIDNVKKLNTNSKSFFIFSD